MSGRRARSSFFWLCAVAACAAAAVGVVRYITLVAEPDAPNSSAQSQASPLPLDEGQREFLWNVEHQGNLLSRYGFQALADALRRGDPQALEDLLASDFRGEVLEQPQEVRLEAANLQAIRQTGAGLPRRKVNRQEFVTRLLDYRRLFGQEPRVQVSLMTLAPSVREEPE